MGWGAGGEGWGGSVLGNMPKKAGNAVNEFDDTAWNAAFTQMTEDRKDDDQGSIATKDAMAVVDKIFDDMKSRYYEHLDVMGSAVEQFGKVSRIFSSHLDCARRRGGERRGAPCSRWRSECVCAHRLGRVFAGRGDSGRPAQPD